MSFIPVGSVLRARRVPENIAHFEPNTAPKRPPPLRNRVLFVDTDETVSSTSRCDWITDESIMLDKGLFDFLMVDNANDNLAMLPQLTEYRLKLHPYKKHEYDGYPMLVQSDVEESYSRKLLVHDPDKHAPWAPVKGGDFKLTRAHVKHKTRYEKKRVLQLHPPKPEAPKERSRTKAVMSKRLKPELARRMETWNKRQPKSNRREQSESGSDLLVNEAAEVLLKLSSSTESFALLTVAPKNSLPFTPSTVSTPRELGTPPLCYESFASSLNTLSTSTEAVLSAGKPTNTLSDIGAAIGLMKFFEEPSLMSPPDLDMSDLETESSTPAGAEDLDEVRRQERAVARRAARKIPPPPPDSTPLRREPQQPRGLEPLRRIARCEAHTQRPVPGKPDHRPAWAKRGGPPDDELKAAQCRVSMFAIAMRESYQSEDADMNANDYQRVKDRTMAHEHLMKPLWRRNGAGAELKHNDHTISCADDSHLRFWKTSEPRGGPDDEFSTPDSKEHETFATKRKIACDRWEAYTSRWGIEDGSDNEDTGLTLAAEEYEFFTEEHDPLDEIFDEPDRPIGAFNPAEIDHHLEVQRQKRMKSFRAAEATNNQLEEWHQMVYSRSSAQMDQAAKKAREALEASRQLLPKAQPKSRSTSPTKKRKRESDDDTESLNQRPKRVRTPTEKATQNSPSISPKRLIVTLKIKRRALQSFRHNGVSTGLDDSSVGEEVVEKITEKLALKLVHDTVEAFEGI